MTVSAAGRVLPGYRPGGSALPGLTLAPSLDAALDQAEEIIVRRARMTAGDDDQDPDVPLPGLPPAVLIAVPDRPASTRLRAILHAGRPTGVAGILLGEWPAGTTGHVAADGVLACDDPALNGTRLFNLAAGDTAAHPGRPQRRLRPAVPRPGARPAPAPPAPLLASSPARPPR